MRLLVFSRPTWFPLLMWPLTPMVARFVMVHSCHSWIFAPVRAVIKNGSSTNMASSRGEHIFENIISGVFIFPTTKITCSFVGPDRIHKLMSRVGRGIILVSDRLTSSETEAFVGFFPPVPSHVLRSSSQLQRDDKQIWQCAHHVACCDSVFHYFIIFASSWGKFFIHLKPYGKNFIFFCFLCP